MILLIGGQHGGEVVWAVVPVTETALSLLSRASVCAKSYIDTFAVPGLALRSLVFDVPSCDVTVYEDAVSGLKAGPGRALAIRGDGRLERWEAVWDEALGGSILLEGDSLEEAFGMPDGLLHDVYDMVACYMSVRANAFGYMTIEGSFKWASGTFETNEFSIEDMQT